MAYIETPRTDAGNATYLSNGHNLDNFSVENSFLSPSKRKDDLISQLRNGRGLSLKTPRARGPLKDLHNLQAAPSQGEFTPLLQSGLRKNVVRNRKAHGGPMTPAFLKANYKGGKSPALPAAEISAVYGYDGESSQIGDDDETPVPQIVNSSVQSTPLAALPKRDAAGLLQDQGQMMTLREQENIINKVEKENFGLKLKIHFLEESLRKAGPGFNEAALRENTDLKVDKITMQKELARAKKTLSQAERDLEAYRVHLQDVQEDLKRKHADRGLREELESLRIQVSNKEAEVKKLHGKLENAESSLQSLEKCRGDIEDLEADVREKDRLIEERDEENENLKAKLKKESEELDDVYEELTAGKTRIESLEETQRASAEQATELKQAHDDLSDVRHRLQDLQIAMDLAETTVKSVKEETEEALYAKQRAEADLDELRDEMSNKSMNTKGLSRQLEDKSNSLQADLIDLRQRYAALEDEKSREARKAQESLKDAERNAKTREQRWKDENESLHHEHGISVRKSDSLAKELKQATRELQIKSEEKDMLHSGHDALTAEYEVLQKELSEACAQAETLRRSLQEERDHALENDRRLRDEAKHEFDRLSNEIEKLNRVLNEKTSQHTADLDRWTNEQRGLQACKEKAEEQAVGLQRTVKKLQETEGTLSGRELKLQEAFESEQQRHRSEEAVLVRQIEELNKEISDKRRALDEFRLDLSRNKEELRMSRREQAATEEKLQALEDEIEVLQGGLDDEAENARDAVNVARKDAELLQSQLQTAKKEFNRAETERVMARGEGWDESLDALNVQLQDLQTQLQQTRSDKQSLQDRLASINIEFHTSRTRSMETEAERDELQSQLKQMQDQVDETFKLDQEKIELRTSKLKLETDVGRLRSERKGLLDKNEALESELHDEIARAASEEEHLNEKVADLQRQMTTASESRDRELLLARQKIQRFELQNEDLENRLSRGEQDGEAAAELSMIQKDLSATRRRETEFFHREAAHKESIRDLRQKVAQLERQIHEAEVSKLAVNSPKSSIGGSAQKNELLESRRQLGEGHQEMKKLRAKIKESEKDHYRKLADAERQAQATYDSYEQQREQLEQELSDYRLRQEDQILKTTSNEKTIARLRTRIQSLEQSLHDNRLSSTGDKTMADERKDLHEMLKDAKLEAEDLRLQITDRQLQVEATSSREKDLRTQLKRVREERILYFKKTTALNTELETVQAQFDGALDKIARQQHDWDGERKAIMSRVRFANTSVSSIDPKVMSTKVKQTELIVQEKDKIHQRELTGLAKQIQWMRARFLREEGFRRGLAYEKRFLLMQIEMFNACNKLDLHLLSELGVTPDRRPSTPPKRPTLRAVSLMFIAGIRMKKMQKDWAVQKKVQAQLAKKLESVRKASGMRSASKKLR